MVHSKIFEVNVHSDEKGKDETLNKQTNYIFLRQNNRHDEKR